MDDWFTEDPPARVTRVGGSRIEIARSGDTVSIRVVAGGGELRVNGQLEPVEEVLLTLAGGAAAAFWDSLQQRPPPDEGLLPGGPGWPPRSDGG